LQVDLFDYDLPQSLIAQTPLAERDSSRLLVLPSGDGLEHRFFSDLPSYLREGDVLVLNRTRVLPARLFGQKEQTGAKIEVLLLNSLPRTGLVWRVLLKPAKRLSPGQRVIFGDGILSGTYLGTSDREGTWLMEFHCEQTWEEVLKSLGQMPLPPYIKAPLTDRERYQTVYARETGSAAAPTAGLHFTPELLARIRDRGVTICEILLHVGLGTFRPVEAEDTENHAMHSEYFKIEAPAATLINQAKAEKRRVIAVGTTSARALEAAAAVFGSDPLEPYIGETNIFITPGYDFRVVDALITNFHLPRSSLLMLVSALAGRERILDAYTEAVRENYRFYSFGDAMFIL
jgi:S-adenosylmethionine:tRNA ribosyltransferase-isomerase